MTNDKIKQLIAELKEKLQALEDAVNEDDAPEGTTQSSTPETPPPGHPG